MSKTPSGTTGHEPYRVHLADVSYFSGKLESYLRYKEIPHERIEMDAKSGVTEIYANTGIRKVPAVETADGLWLKETTNMIDWFEEHYPAESVLPDDPALAFLSKLVEDYADEWCWRSAMYWRWRSSDNARLLGSRIGHEVFADWPIPASWSGTIFKWRQRLTFLRGDGLNKETESVVRNQYLELSQALTALLKEQPFLLGNRPSLVDIAFMGPFFRHYFCDPVPARIMRDDYPAVLAWVTRVWAARSSEQPETVKWSDFKQPGWEMILKELMAEYLPYLHANKAAFEKRQKTFSFDTRRTTFKRLPVIHHRVYCLERLEDQYQALDAEAKASVDAVLKPYGEITLTGKTVSGISNEYELPLKPRSPIGRMEYLQAYLLGSPWDMNKKQKA